MHFHTTTLLRQAYDNAGFIRGWGFFQVRQANSSGTTRLTMGKDFYEICLTLFLVLAFIPHFVAQSVNIGVPPVWNYSRKMYAAGTQNWDAAQDASGRMYFANNDGLLRFDGTYWTCYPVSNHTIVRSVAIDGAGRIFTGAQSEIGFFFPGPNGDLLYTSLIGLLPPGHRTFEDVWDIAFRDEKVFFRTNKEVFEYTGNEVLIHQYMGELLSLFASSAGLMLQSADHQISIYRNGKFTPHLKIGGVESSITGMCSWTADTVLCSTLKNGLFYLTSNSSGPWRTGHDDLIAEKRIYSSTVLSDGNIALGTSLDGIVVLDRQRRVFRHLNKKHGLQNNNILSAFCDRDGNLWLGLDNGIDVVVLDSRFTSVFPDDELQGTGYTAAVYQNQLYLGVSNGAYTAPWQSYYDPEKRPYFHRVLHGDGQVWGFTQLPDALLMGHHEGAFQIREKEAVPMSGEQGTWTYIPLNEAYLMAGTYTGLTLYKKDRGKWVWDGKIKGINESCRIMVRDADGSIWVSHPYRGLYQVKWSPERKYDPEVKFFDQSGGLPGNLNNYVFSIAGKAVFGTEKGVYRFDARQTRFVPDTSFNHRIGSDHRVKCMKEDPDGNIWYVTDQEVGRLIVDDYGLKKEISKQVFPELLGKLVGGFEFIYPVDQRNVIFGTEEGFVLYDARPAGEQKDTLEIVLHSLRASRHQDSLLFGGYFLPAPNKIPGEPHELPSGLNTLSFAFSATEYRTPNLVQYRTWLEGLEESWSPWTTDTRRDYTALGHGHYIFHAQARVGDEMESRTVRYAFSIRPPWYKSHAAMAMYVLSFLGLFAGFILTQRKRFETEKARMTKTHQQKEARAIREVEQSKAALTEIQNEKLEVEIKYKNQELALTTMHLVQKADILLTVQEALKQIQEKSSNPEVKKDIHQLLNLVNFDVKLDEDWAHFAHHFDQVHVDFLKNLRERFPQLSASDLKLCAYLRMNLSTKEIAPLLNISVRGVEGSRYRLRKKLDLPNDANLTDFILGFSPHQG